MKNILLFISILIMLKLNAQQGTLDSSFGQNGVTLNKNNGAVNAVALQKSGKIIVCGSGRNDGVVGYKLVRYNINGSIDSSFGKNGFAMLDRDIYGNGDFSALSITEDDKIIAVANSTDIFVAKFTADGKLDSSFGTNGYALNNFVFYESVFAVTIQQDGKIIVDGSHSTDFYSPFYGIIARYNQDGKLDINFGDSGEVVLEETTGLSSLAIQKDGKILAGGSGGYPDNAFYVARLNEDGNYDKSFGNKGYVYTRFSKINNDGLASLAIQPDGKILGAGISNIYSADEDMGVARYNTDGSLDSGFGINGLQSININNSAEAKTVLLQKDGKIILSGRTFDDIKLTSDAVLVRLNSNGTLDSSFAINGISITDLSNGNYDAENGAVLQQDGKIIVAGESHIDKDYDNIARFNNNDLSKKQIIITKIKRWLQHHNGFTWDNNSINNYVVQRSYDGIHWKAVSGKQRAMSNSSVHYYEDPSPLSGANYYRLQTTSTAGAGTNGAINYSNVIAVTNSDIKISPNPAKNVLQIQGLQSNKTKLTVVDFTGNIKLGAIANDNSYNLNIASLKTGNYLLRIETGDNVITKKFVKE